MPENISKAGSCLAKFIAFIFSVLFIVFTPLVLIFFNFQQHLLSSDIYKSALAEQDFYDLLPSMLGEQLITGLSYNPCEADPTTCEDERVQQPDKDSDEEGQGGPPSYFTALDAQGWEDILTALFPEGWLQSQTESVLDQLFASLYNADPPPLTISTREFREHLSGSNAEDLVEQILSAFPACTEAELDQLSSLDLDEDDPQIPICQPSEEILDSAVPELAGFLTKLVEDIEDETVLSLSGSFGDDNEGDSGKAQTTNDDGPFGDDPLLALRRITSIFRFSPLILITLLFFISLLAVRSLKTFLVWWGAPFLVGGILALIPAIAVVPLLNWTFDTFAVPRIPEYVNIDIIDSIFGVVQQVATGIVTWIGGEAGLLVVFGFVMLVASRLIKKESTVNLA
ncbi:MAG: hypothetical protein FVQ83_05600 [Chloroflexi bacterium]|nr:hypothetical protein [Chloroflexota bacterium]